MNKQFSSTIKMTLYFYYPTPFFFFSLKQQQKMYCLEKKLAVSVKDIYRTYKDI